MNLYPEYVNNAQEDKQPNFKRGRGGKDTIRMVNRNCKTMKYSILTVIRKTQIKTTTRYPYPPTQVAKIKQTGNGKCRRGHGTVETLVTLPRRNIK